MIKVGICLDDIHFAHALSKGLIRECANILFVLLQHMEDGEDCDLILSFEKSSAPRVIQMVRGDEEENIFGDPPYRVYRYKDSRSLVNDLLFIHFKLTGRNLELLEDVNCRVLVFASVSGGCGCTALSISVGEMLYKLYGSKCLYLNLCPVDDSKRYLPAKGEKGLLTLLYYLDGEKDFPMRAFISHSHNIDYIDTKIMNSHFDEMHQNLLTRFMKKIDELGQYTYLIVDISNHISRTNKQILHRADQVILLHRSQDQLPEPYFSKLVTEMEKLSSEGGFLKVQISQDVDGETDSGILSISQEKSCLLAEEEGVIDLSKMELLQLEAYGIVKTLMGESEKS